MSKFRCSGQTCSVSLLLTFAAIKLTIQSGILDEFTPRQVQKVFELRPGPGIEDSCTQGPLINVPAVDKVKSHLHFLHLLFLQPYTAIGINSGIKW
jgi:succinate-semialdehyde dehydrogenase/glutarate-semialdehyde dehydrogenase